MNDVIVTGNDLKTIEEFKSSLDKQFKIKDLGNLKYILGIEVTRSKEWIYLCIKIYALDLLTNICLIGSKPSKVPLDQNLKLSRGKGELLPNPMIYKRLVGKLMYLTLIRPDLS